MSWPQRQEQGNALVTAQTLEERINMYINAMDRATAMNDGHQSSQLQQDIQKLVDLMEKINAGHVVTEQEVPPPLVITPQIDVLANPLGELSSRLAEYHKALYFAEEELSEDRMNKIQNLQKGLQIIHGLQKHAQAGFPVRADEIPPPVTIPSDDEFDPDAVNTLTSRLAHYREAMSFASQSENDRRRLPKLESAIRTVEFLLTRAKAKRPVWKKDIPPEFDYSVLDSARQGRSLNKAKFTLQLRSLQKRVQNITFREEDQQKQLDKLKTKLQEFEAMFPRIQASDELLSCLTDFMKETETLEKLAFAEKTKDLNRSEENLNLIEVRLNEYKTAIVASKQGGQMKHAIQHFKVVKGLQALKEALENGEPVDMTLVPPPPREFTPTSESPPSLTDMNQGIVATAEVAAHNAAGITAHLSPVVIKPAVESAEDKLAKKLFSYLDEGTDFSLPASKQVQNIDNINVTPTHFLPKVQNTENRKDNLLVTSCNNSGSFNITGSVVNGTGPTAVNIENFMDVVSGQSSPGCKENTAMQKVDFQTAENVKNYVSKTEPLSKAGNVQDQGSHGKENQVEEMKNQNKEMKASDTSSPKTSPSKSSDIYVRKTLDSVNFLPCQNVPHHSAQSKEVFVPSDSENLESGYTSTKLDTLGQRGAEADLVSGSSLMTDDSIHSSSMFGSGHGDLPSVDFINPLTQPDQVNSQSAPAATTSTLTSNMHIEPLSEEQSGEVVISNYSQNTGNDWSSAGSSSITLPVHGSDTLSENMDSGPLSLPSKSMPKVLTNLSNGEDALPSLHSLSVNHVPDIATLASFSAKGTSNSHSNISTGDFDQQLTQREGQESDMTFNAQINSIRKDGSTSKDTDSGENERNERTSSDDLEFLDLMDSMAIPSIAVPVSVIVISSSSVTLPSHQFGQLAPSVSNQGPSVLSEQNASQSEVSASLSKNFGTQAFSQENDNSEVSSFTPSYTLPSVDEVNGSITGEEKTILPFTSEDVRISSHVSQNHVHTSSSPSVSDLPEDQQHTAHTSIRYTTASESRTPGHENVLNGSHAMAAPISQLQSHQGQNLSKTTSSHSQPSVSSSKFQSVSTARPATDFAYSDVAFTCLENLKYDCLLSSIRKTDESKREEKKLRAKFELIKNKLRGGGKRTWEVYKACVEREHASLIQQIEDLRLLQQWNDMQLLSEKKSIAERELGILRERLSELKY